MQRDITAIEPVVADERVPYGRDPNQFFDVWHARGRQRARAVFIHGGFWRAKYNLSHASHLCAALAERGIGMANLEYRRVGNGGGWPTSFEDVLAGIAFASQHLGGAVVLLGHSAGGHLALRAAAEELPLTFVVPLAPVADLRRAHELRLSNDAVAEFVGSENIASFAAADPMQHASRVPCTIVHGERDEVVPIELSERYVAAHPETRLVRLAYTGHFELIDPESDAFETVVQQIIE